MGFSEVNNNPIDSLWDKTPDYLHELEEGEVFSLADDTSRFFVRGYDCEVEGREFISCFEFTQNICCFFNPDILPADSLVWRQIVKFEEK